MAYQKLQAGRAALVVPSDTDEIPAVTGGTNNGCVLYIGTPGDIQVKTVGGDVVTFVGVYAGQFFQLTFFKYLQLELLLGRSSLYGRIF